MARRKAVRIGAPPPESHVRANWSNGFTVSYPLLSIFLNQLKLVYGPLGQSNMNSTLDFCPRPARKETNVPLNKVSEEITVLIYCVSIRASLNCMKQKLG